MDSRPFQIEVTLNMEQFDLYEICSDTMLTFSIKDFKVLLSIQMSEQYRFTDLNYITLDNS